MNILLISHDSSIISMVKHSLKKQSSTDRLFVARTGREAVDFLNRSLNSTLDLIPGLVMVDLDSSEANGLYLLQRLTTDLQIEGTQVVVFTSPLEKRDLKHLESLDLDYLIEKPVNNKNIKELLEVLDIDWSEDSQVAPRPYARPKPRLRDEGELRRVLVVENSTEGRKRLSQSIRNGSIAALNFDFPTSWAMAKRRVKREEFGALVLAVTEKDLDKASEVIAIGRERLNASVIALVEPGDEDAGKAAVMAGADLFLIRDSGNYLSVLLELLSNMVERRRLEILSARANDADKEMLREIIEQAPLMMLRIDQSFTIKDCNETFARASQLLRHTVVGKHLFDILPDLEIMPIISVLEDAVPYSREGYRMKTIGQTHTATTYWDFHVWSIRRTLSTAPEAILVAADVSGRIELEQQRERFVAALAHDIRNPLVGGQRVIDSILSGKHGELEPARARQLMTSLQKSNQSLLLMLSNLIDVYKFETASMTLQFRPLDLGELVREQILEIAHVAASAGVEISHDIPEALPSINGDITAVRRLLMNLLHNALKYCTPESKVEVRVRALGKYSVFARIKNQGNPIGVEKLRGLFRNVVAGVPMKHGSGLGLYLCRKIADAHGASIKFKSTESGITEVEIRFDALNEDGGTASAAG